MIKNLTLLSRPTGFYHYYDDDSKVIYNASNTLDADNCKKVQFVTNDTDSNLKDVTGLTYKNAEKLSVTFIKGSSAPTISVYLDSLISDGDKLDASTLMPIPNPIHKKIAGFSPEDGEANYTDYVKSYYKCAVATALANGESAESIYNKLPDYVKYTTTPAATLNDGETAKVATDINPGLTRTVTWESGEITNIKYDISDELKTYVETVIKQDVIAYANTKLKNINKTATGVSFTYNA